MAAALNRRKDRRAKTTGLTLVELAVVMAMTALLASLLLPALSTAKEKSRRAVCKSNLRQLLMVLQDYGNNNEDFLPTCADNKGYYHSIVLSDQVFTNLVELAGGNPNIFYCPNIVFGNGPAAVAPHYTQYGYVIGYSYLAASINSSIKSPDYTLSPVKWPFSTTNELLADPNFWTASGSGNGYFPSAMKVAPHTSMGAAMSRGSSFTVGLPGISSASIGAAGGNVGLVDGSVQWINIRQMQTNYASTLLDAYASW